MSAQEALAYLSRRRRRHRLGEITFGDVAYQVEIVGVPTAALVFLGFWAESQRVEQVPAPPWLAWAVTATLAAYTLLRVLSAAALGPIRLTPAEAQLLVSAPVPARRLLLPKLAAAAGREAAGAAVVALAWAAQTAVVLGAPFWTTLGMSVAGLVPYAVAVVSAAWLVENAPRAQRGIRAALPRVAWLPAAVVAAAPFVLGGVDVGSTPEVAYWWGPWAWAAAPGLRAMDGTVAPAGAVLAAVLAAVLVTASALGAARPATEAIALRSRLLAQRPALAFFRDTVGLHSLRRQLWSRTGAVGLRSGRPRGGGARALVWKSTRHLLREGTAAWGLPLAGAITVGIAAAHAQPAVAVALALVVLYFPASRVVSPVLADLEALTATSQLPFPSAVRALAALSGPALLLTASSVAAGVILLATGELAPVRAGAVTALVVLGMLLALACAAFGVVPRDLSALFLLPQELAFLARYPGQVLWLAAVAATVAAAVLRTPALGIAVAAAAVVLSCAMYARSYGRAAAPA